ncbi:hypothetical protein PAXRUDRAFT_831479 [Paxillus rubicundulus Ve08.2h10]|uniref:Secreted protein n=1 Tax=Paxillus rubicundulus Ve08.2h10 TaxID=930991 RepID=A0A0D0E1V6_9AGAM|nr:hypothetical protein PAXRUDRAFT_831479 [Paxillus rubicundulus Ve08.2h10]
MKTFLTLLAAITSLSAYTLVGVHGCVTCPDHLKGKANLVTGCTDGSGVTSCEYQKKMDPFRYCQWNVRSR